MALPRTDAERSAALKAVESTPPDWFVKAYRSFWQEEVNKGPPPLRPWPYRLWCALRGHSATYPLPGPIYFDAQGLCKNCGARIVRRRQRAKPG